MVQPPMHKVAMWQYSLSDYRCITGAIAHTALCNELLLCVYVES